ncbi:hypothetical protein HDV05_004803 [Chytridiales sp. JEL 0842]|nr:hypothetical protein HDV05_004803 [Chytridiales sp. JEL 0842]
MFGAPLTGLDAESGDVDEMDTEEEGVGSCTSTTSTNPIIEEINEEGETINTLQPSSSSLALIPHPKPAASLLKGGNYLLDASMFPNCLSVLSELDSDEEVGKPRVPRDLLPNPIHAAGGVKGGELVLRGKSLEEVEEEGREVVSSEGRIVELEDEPEEEVTGMDLD